jgi:hypothetical protein
MRPPLVSALAFLRLAKLQRETCSVGESDGWGKLTKPLGELEWYYNHWIF